MPVPTESVEKLSSPCEQISATTAATGVMRGGGAVLARIVTLIVGFGATGAGGDGGPRLAWPANGSAEETMPDDLAARLAGNWTVTEVFQATIPPEVEPTLVFEAERLAGFAGCNRFGMPLGYGPGGALTLGLPAATRKSCGGPVMDLEKAILSALRRINKVAFEADDAIALSAYGLQLMRAKRAE